MSSLEDYIKVWIDTALALLKARIDDKTPIDTSTLIGNNQITPAYQDWLWVRWTIKNETPYAPYVEYWVGNKAYHYHKGKSVFYTGVWARMYTRTADESGNDVRALIENSIAEYISFVNKTNGK